MKVKIIRSFWCPLGTFNPSDEPVEMDNVSAETYSGYGYVEKLPEDKPVEELKEEVQVVKRRPEKIKMNRYQAPAVEDK